MRRKILSTRICCLAEKEAWKKIKRKRQQQKISRNIKTTLMNTPCAYKAAFTSAESRAEVGVGAAGAWPRRREGETWRRLCEAWRRGGLRTQDSGWQGRAVGEHLLYLPAGCCCGLRGVCVTPLIGPAFEVWREWDKVLYGVRRRRISYAHNCKQARTFGIWKLDKQEISEGSRKGNIS